MTTSLHLSLCISIGVQLVADITIQVIFSGGHSLSSLALCWPQMTSSFDDRPGLLYSSALSR